MVAAEFADADNELFELDRDDSLVWFPWPPPSDDDDVWFDNDAARAAIDAECLFDWLDFFDDDWELFAACCMAKSSLCNTAGLYGFGNDL